MVVQPDDGSCPCLHFLMLLLVNQLSTSWDQALFRCLTLKVSVAVLHSKEVVDCGGASILA